MSLRDLDDDLVPRLAEALDRVVARLRGAFPNGRQPAGPLPLILRLRRLDDRFTGSGPLALFREVPQLGAVAIAALVFTSSITVVSRTARTERAAQRGGGDEGPGEADGPTEGVLGPGIGDSVDAYVEGTKTRLRRLAGDDADEMAVAVLMLTGYRTPEQVRDLLGPIQARVVFYRPPTPDGLIRQIGVDDLVRDIRKDFTKVAGSLDREAKELRRVAATIKNDRKQQQFDLRNAAQYERQVKLLRGDCACVFAVVVRAQVRMLADALNLPAVRAIDTSAPDAELGGFTFTALLPEEKEIVTGGNQEPGS